MDWMDKNKTDFLSYHDVDDGYFYGDKGHDVAYAASYHPETDLVKDWDGFRRINKKNVD